MKIATERYENAHKRSKGTSSKVASHECAVHPIPVESASSLESAIDPVPGLAEAHKTLYDEDSIPINCQININFDSKLSLKLFEKQKILTYKNLFPSTGTYLSRYCLSLDLSSSFLQ